MLLISRQIDVARGPADQPVRQQRITAAECAPVPGRRAQRNAGHLRVGAVTGIRPEAAAAARSTG
jgi:hypothetical protein